MSRAAQVTPRTLTGWLFTATLRGMVTGVLFPIAVAIGLIVWAATQWINPPELPPGTTSSSTESSLGGMLAGAGYFGLLTMIASSVGAVVGSVIGLVVGVVCAVVDLVTRRRLDAVVVALVGAAAYVVTAVALVIPSDDLPVALLVAGPGLLGAATLKIVPLEMPSPIRSLAMTPVVRIRPARSDDGERLREIERAAGERFREVDLVAIAEDEPMSIDELAAYADAGRSWVAAVEVDGTELVVGYVLVDVVDGDAHVEQLSVDPKLQGRGIGRALLARVDEYARTNALGAVTLTTFRDVPWNAPLYAHLGFRELTPAEIGPELAALVRVEASHGLDPEQRVCMRRSL